MEVPCFPVDNTHHFEYCFLKIYPDIKLPPQVDHTKQKRAFGEVGTWNLLEDKRVDRGQLKEGIREADYKEE